MNLIDALKAANGKCVTREIYRQEESDYFVESSRTARLHWVGYPNDPLPTDHVLADDWYVVEPKSKIEEAIEREAKKFWGSIPVGRDAMAELVSMGRRIVNLTLDEAIAICEEEEAYKSRKRIDALKVKE